MGIAIVIEVAGCCKRFCATIRIRKTSHTIITLEEFAETPAKALTQARALSLDLGFDTSGIEPRVYPVGRLTR